MSNFVGLHVHSEYSLLDGASQLPNLIDQAAELGMEAIALTDHGVMYGAIELIKTCRGKGIKPIVGNEMYIINGDITKQEKKRKYHQIVLAKNTQGYKNLVKLTTISHLQGYQGKGIFARPCISKDYLEKYKEGLIVTSGCLAGEVPQAILQGHPEIAREVAAWYKEVFGGDYYLEIQDHGYPEDRTVNVEIVKIARELDIKIVATNDSHFVSCHDVEAHDALLCIQTGKLITEVNRLHYSGTEYLKSADEMKLMFRDHLPDDVIAEAISNTVEVAAKVKSYDIMSDPRAAEYPVPQGHTADTYLEAVTWQGLMERFQTERRSDIPDNYQQRIHYELQIMQQMGFSTYFLVVWDYIKYARDRGIPVGPGRGCVLPDTNVLLSSGKEIPIHEVQIGQEVVTHAGNLLPVEDKLVYDCDEEIIKIKVASEELCLTQDHKIWAVRSADCAVNSAKTANVCKPTCTRYCSVKPCDYYQLQWIAAGELSKDDFVAFPRIPSEEVEIVFDVVEYVAAREHLRYDKEFIWYEIGSNQLATKRIPRYISYDEDLARLLGYYIAEGWSRLGERECTVGFGFSSKETTYANEVQQLLKNIFGLDANIVPHHAKQSIQVLTYSRTVGEFLSSLCGIGANHKSIPTAVVLKGKSELIKILIAYMFRGDGHNGSKEKTTAIKYTTTSSALAMQLRSLLARFGYWVSIIKSKRGKQQDNWAIEYSVKLAGSQLLNWNSDFWDFPIGVKEQKFFRNDSFYVDDRYIYLKIRSAEKFHYKGKVYDITVPGDTSYVANSIAIHNSAAGSLVAYALGITNIDPIHHGLLFERFLNPERKSMPDIDTDFCIDHRNELIEYVTQRYGDDRVAQIVTFNRLTSKAVLKDVGRVLDISYGEADKMAKMIPVFRGKPAKLKTMISDETPAPEFKERYEKDPKVFQWLDMAMRIEGVNKSSGVHAAGVVISPMPLDEVVPLQRSNDGAVVTQYPMEDLESLGLLKMDFLGLRNLTTIQHTVDLIEKGKNIAFDINAIAPDASTHENEKTYQLLARGELEGIFQLESSGMKQIVRDLKPSNIDDISSILALYRPGPLDAGLIPKFINRKHGREAMDYAHPDLEPILQETYSILVFQEQIMKIAQDLAGYTLGEADLLRRAMGKKKPAEMEKQREKFLDGAAKNGIKSKIATDLFDQMVLFAEYCFNKSHSVAYGYVTYQTAYLKANYPVEYMAALLSSVSGDQAKVQRYIASCNSMNIDILPPDVNTSGVDFTPRDRQIVFGLAAIKNLGGGAIDSILEARQKGGKFKSLADLCSRVDSRALNKKALEALIQTGALDSIQPNRHQLMSDLEITLEWASRKAKEQASGQVSLFDLLTGDTSESAYDDTPSGPKVQDYPPQEKLRMEKELLGFYISDHPLKVVGKSAKLMAPINLSDLADSPENTTLTAIVLILDIKDITTKKGDRMAVLQIEDLTGSSEAVVFPKIYEKVRSHLQKDNRLMVWGKADRRDDRVQLVIDDMQPIESVRMVRVELDREQAMDIQKLHQLREILRAQTGEKEGAKVPVIASIAYHSQMVRLGNQHWVSDDKATVKALTKAGFTAFPDALANEAVNPL
ncbi:DNA polymerase III subunit alpha [Pseudanabaena sp. PCC 6802]|uniref:DNA polymerase III subunit alpha n=1 Tax=Pseudanabaena sp. PCC 6802 TaxID=118173 RepID=UPI00034AC0C3|nr:DNA polymerase III subunit alpha [Pseudanabaena sp. PCC 6802]